MTITKHTKILVVDDFEVMRKVTTAQLRSLGAAQIFQAKDGAEALRLLNQQPFDLVLSDWNMPIMTGLELLIAVRASEKLSHIPFIMITAEAERERVVEAIAQGVNALLVKPYTRGGLAERISMAITSRPRKVVASSPRQTHFDIEAPQPTIKSDGLKVESKRSTILVVDDTSDNVELMFQLFKDTYRVRISLNGQRALDICTSDDPPDLVLLDIMMPGLDGFEVAQLMREHPNSEHIPIIFVTGMETDEAHLKGMALGAVDFVTKPINPDFLVPRIRNFLRYVELRKQLQAEYDTLLENARLREDVENITRHDVKGPLAGIISIIQTLGEDVGLSRKQIEQLRMAEDAALQALNMINLSAELYKIETGRFKLNAEPVKIGEILRRIVDFSRHTFSEKHLIISVDTDVAAVNEDLPQSIGEAMLCYSLFQNLIKNACEAAPEKTQVEVVLHNENPLRITITNTGVVPLAIRNQFFEKFVTYGKSGGTGLGTYSAKLLAEAQKGSISLDVSGETTKTLITVSLPRYLA
jgi:two-component system sensor histidine kinase/response regulator